MKTTQRIRRSDAQWAALLQQFNASGLPATTFCQQRGICYGTFANRRRRAVANPEKKAPKPLLSDTTDWLPIDLAGDDNPRHQGASPATTPDWDIELALPGGVQLRLRAHG